MNIIFRALRLWLPTAIAVTGLSFLGCLLAHQLMRQYVNDPQLQMAQDAARIVAGGADPASVLPAGRVDLATSLAPYTTVFDARGTAVASSGLLDGALPDLPDGLFGHAARQGEHRLTWQPRPGVRQAVVLVAVDHGRAGFVMAARSLRETEERKLQVLRLVALGCMATLLATLLLAALIAWSERRVST